MRSIRIFTAAAVASLLTMAFAPSTASTYGVSGVGGSGGFVSPEARDATGTVGMHAELEQPGTKFHLVPGLMFWGSDERKNINPNMDVLYHVRAEGKVTPYVGAGVGMHMRSGPLASDEQTDLGMNLMGGVRFPGRTARIFVEGRHTVSDVSQSAVLAGATFKLGS